jgi:chemotaxis protein methyltransferase WspC
MNRIEQLLQLRIGLNPGSIGSPVIQRAVRFHMKRLGFTRIEDYQPLLGNSSAEWNELVESVVVSETWFFRDPETLALFVRLVSEQWLPAHPKAPLRVLSIPCSSGEEPDSLAMALVDMGLPPHRIQIDAADISARALAHARGGVYGRHSFRSKDRVLRDRFFEGVREEFVLNRLVRDAKGDPSAVDYYRKALYLQPAHYEALLQMALFSQKNGHPELACALRCRAQRLKTDS